MNSSDERSRKESVFKMHGKKMASFLLAGIIVSFFTVFVCQPPKAYSQTERRVLANRPELSMQKILSGQFMTDAERYLLDQFPLRDRFLLGKINFDRDILKKKDANGYYLSQGHISRLEPVYPEKRLSASLKRQEQIYQQYLKNTNCNIYISVIPDKNYYLAHANGYPSMDYARYVEEVKEHTKYGTYIDIFESLFLQDYYFTDQHIRQERYREVVCKLGQSMNRKFGWNYEQKEIGMPFYGAYYQQGKIGTNPDKLKYLTNDLLRDCIVTSYNSGRPQRTQMYDLEKAEGRDGYEMFLGGADALITIDNPSTQTENELILFRDSFGSAIAPLLLSDYRKITLVDLRYFNPSQLEQYIQFSSQDVLFLYSTLVF